MPAGDLRISIYPALFGERAVVRLPAADIALNAPARISGLDDLGIDPPVLAKLKGLLERPQGLLLLTGPAGSGKTTTLYASLSWLVSRWNSERHIVTIEDPVERVLDGVTQTQINPAAGLNFSTALRSLLRQDPEILMIGEIRDAQTAEIAVHACGVQRHGAVETLRLRRDVRLGQKIDNGL